MSSAADWLNSCLKSIDHKLFKDVINVSSEDEPMSDGQVVIASDINRVTLTLETSTGEKRTLKAVAKFEPPPGYGRDLTVECGGFENETLMYTEILKTMEKLSSDVGDSNCPWPEFYHCNDNKFLLQDLCEAGYKIVPTYKFLDLNHSLLVMKALGKFHALSMVMEKRGILDKTKLNPCYLTQGPQFIVTFYKMSVEALAADIKKTWGPEWSSVPDRIMKFIDNTKQKIQDLAHATEMKWKVLNHGDFTLRNMLFHYKPNSDVPDDIKFVDFQTVHWNDPGFDVSNLLYSSLLPQVRDDNMELLLNAYIDSLTSTCKQHHYQEPTPTTEYVANSIKSLKFLTTCTSFLALPFFIMSETENMQKTMETGDKHDQVDLSYRRNDRVKQVMQYEIERCMKENIF